MKRLLVLSALFLFASGADAQLADEAALKRWVTRAMARCAGGSIELQRVQQTGPQGFAAWLATLRSTDEHCGGQKYVLYSPMSQQILLGTVVPLPADGRPLLPRLTDEVNRRLAKPHTLRLSPVLLPDGLKHFTMTRAVEWGTFGYSGYVDASEKYLIVGFRGNLKTDPEKTLLDQLGVSSAARRGNAKAATKVLEMSDFQCPTCARAHKTMEPMIAKNLGNMEYMRLDLPLFESHEWSFQAAMMARAIQRVAPAKYWTYVDSVFEAQERLSKNNIESFIRNFAEDHDIDWAAAQKIYASKSERQALLDQVARAFDAGVLSTPTFIVNGSMLGYGPEGKFTIDTIKAAVAKPAAKPATPAAKKKK